MMSLVVRYVACTESHLQATYAAFPFWCLAFELLPDSIGMACSVSTPNNKPPTRLFGLLNLVKSLGILGTSSFIRRTVQTPSSIAISFVPLSMFISLFLLSNLPSPLHLVQYQRPANHHDKAPRLWASIPSYPQICPDYLHSLPTNDSGQTSIFTQA